MAIFSSTITDLVANKAPQPYYRFDGDNDYISLPASSNYYFGRGDFSVEVWVKTTSDGRNIALHRNSGSTRYILLEIDSSKARLLMWKSSANYSIATGTSNINDGEWHHIVVTRNSSVATVYIYVDGILEGSGTDNALDAPEDSNWYLASQTGGDKFMNGSISSFKLFNIALTAGEVKQHYSGVSVPWRYANADSTYTHYIANAGHAATTDWTDDDSNGLANGISGEGTTAIVTGNGFTGNAQRSMGSSGYGSLSIPLSTSFGAGETLYLRCKYRSSGESFRLGKQYGGGGASQYHFGDGTYNPTGKVWYRIDGGNWTGGGQETIPVNTGNAKTLEAIIFTGTATSGHVGFTTVPWNEYVELDEVEIYRGGCVAEYDGSGIASDKWFDKSGNDLHGTVSGATVENAPSGDSGLVYEEGTWTPEWQGGSTSGQTYSHQVGTYTRIGNRVLATFYLETTDKGTFSDWIVVANLPYTSASTPTNKGYSAWALGRPESFTLDSGHYLAMHLSNNTTSSHLLQCAGTGSSDSPSLLTGSNLNDSTALTGHIVYVIDT